MTFKLTMDQKPAYLHAVVTGANNRENVARYLDEILCECMARHCRKVLIEERLEGPRLGMLDVFIIVSEGSSKASGLLEAIAFVDVHAERNLMEFAETVAVNRSMPVAVFTTIADAEGWLLGNGPATSTDAVP